MKKLMAITATISPQKPRNPAMPANIFSFFVIAIPILPHETISNRSPSVKSRLADAEMLDIGNFMA